MSSPEKVVQLTRGQTRFGTWRKLWLNLAIAEKVRSSRLGEARGYADATRSSGCPSPTRLLSR